MPLLNSARLALAGATALVVAIGVAGGVLLADAAQRTWRGHLDYAGAAKSLDRAQASRLRLEAQYPGPLRDTLVQRWLDPVDGTVCYIYLPVAVANSAGPEGLVQYGANHIGSVSCFPRPG